MPPRQRRLFPRLSVPSAKPARTRAAQSRAAIYVVKVTLLGSKPPIWRRVGVPPDITLAKLHDVLQVVMGWEDCHLHMFTSRDQQRYGTIDGEAGAGWDDDLHDETKARLRDLLHKPKDRCVYEYDFGDSWEHRLELEKAVGPEAGVRYPACLAGKRACPPEDCGGVWGYANMLHALADPEHPEHADRREWIGGKFDAEALNLEKISAALRRLR